jgi:hypothetical protein
MIEVIEKPKLRTWDTKKLTKGIYIPSAISPQGVELGVTLMDGKLRFVHGYYKSFPNKKKAKEAILEAVDNSNYQL